MLDARQRLFHYGGTLFSLEQFRRRTVLKERQRSFKPMCGLPLVAEYSDGMSDYWDEPVNNQMYRHSAIVASKSSG